MIHHLPLSQELRTLTFTITSWKAGPANELPLKCLAVASGRMWTPLLNCLMPEDEYSLPPMMNRDPERTPDCLTSSGRIKPPTLRFVKSAIREASSIDCGSVIFHCQWLPSPWLPKLGLKRPLHRLAFREKRHFPDPLEFPVFTAPHRGTVLASGVPNIMRPALSHSDWWKSLHSLRRNRTINYPKPI